NLQRCSTVSDASVKNLSDMMRLKVLNLRGTQISSDGLRDLAALKHLSELVIDNEKITNEVLVDMSRSQLIHALPIAFSPRGRAKSDEETTRIDLNGTAVDSDRINVLANLKNLAEINLGHMRVGPEIITLGKSPSIKKIQLDKESITDELLVA